MCTVRGGQQGRTFVHCATYEELARVRTGAEVIRPKQAAIVTSSALTFAMASQPEGMLEADRRIAVLASAVVPLRLPRSAQYEQKGS
ncbi:hypothetical protein TQ38_002590 [Novosphingobium sp. P6W]|nr:hypothetical protein TQ38_002590 [Novosphingobium sp. P6W]KIS30206.1 hypothetical protein TQ38_23890 [Novosphingobium sp. P6W]